MPPPIERALLQQASALRALARDLVGAEAADDVLQETALAALQKPPRREGELRGWLVRIAQRLALRRRRGEQRRRRHEAAAEPPPAPRGPADEIEHRDTLRAVTDALLALPAPYQRALLLRYFEDLPPAAIAARTGEGVATVKSRLARGLALLREALAGGGGRRDWRAGLLALAGLRGAGRGGVAAAITGVLLMGSGVKLLLGGVGAAIAVVAALWLASPPAVVSRDAEGLPANVPAAVQARAENVPQSAPVAPAMRTADAEPAPRAQEVAGEGALEIFAKEQGGQAAVGMDFHLANATGPGAAEPRKCTTDATGLARADGLRAGVWRIGSSAKATGGREVTIRKDEVTTVTLTVGTFRNLHGRVVDEDGVPIAGAIVNASGQKPWDLPDWQTVTDARGGFAIAAVRLPCMLYAEAVGHLQSQIEQIWERADEERTLICSRGGGSIEVRLQTEGVARGAIATLFRPGKGREVQVRQRRCDDAGRVRFLGLVPGQYCVRAECDGFVPAQHGPLAVAIGHEASVSMHLQRGVDLAGVVSTEDGSAVAGARVECRISDRDSATVVSDAAGRFLLRGVAPGLRTLVARQGSVGAGRADATVGAQGMRDVRIVLHEGIALSGVVVDEQGRGIAGVQVTGDGRERQYAICKTTTDGDGRFVLRGLPDEGLERLRFYLLSYQEAALEAGELDGRPLRVTLKRHEVRLNRIVGTVVDEAGVPVAGALVSASIEGERSGSVGATDSSTGRFEIESELGSYRLAVRCDGYVDSQPKECVLAQGPPLDVGAVVLKRGRRIVVRFTGVAPVEEGPGGGCFFVEEGEQPRRWMPRLGNRYVSPCLEPGTYSVVRNVNGQWQLVREVEVGAGEDVVLSLDR